MTVKAASTLIETGGLMSPFGSGAATMTGDVAEHGSLAQYFKEPISTEWREAFVEPTFDELCEFRGGIKSLPVEF